MSNGYNIYTSILANNHEFGTAFLVECVIRIKGRFSTTLTKNDSEEKANFMNSWSRHTQPAQIMT
jgi:hypothetical protein